MRPIKLKMTLFRYKLRYQVKKYSNHCSDYHASEFKAWKTLRNTIVWDFREQESVITRLLIKNFKKL